MKISLVKHYCKIFFFLLFGSLITISASVGYRIPSNQPSLFGVNADTPNRAHEPWLQQEGGSCYSLDVIFVIDQSSTMSDSNYPTDPTNQREYAIEAMVDWLASNILDVCREARHQVGVISFGGVTKIFPSGTNSRIDLPLTEIAPRSIEELRALEKRINEDIIADDLGGTEPIEAFRKISKMFDDGHIEGGGIRKRVVVFLTDGLIGADSIRENPPEGFVIPTQELSNYIDVTLPFDPVLLKREQCISALVSAYGKFENIEGEKLRTCYVENDVNESAYRNSTYLYVVLMNYGRAWPSEIKKIYKKVAESHAGEVMDFYDTGSQNRNEIPAYFVTVLTKLVGVATGQVDCGGVAVNPYLDKAIFMFYKFSPDTEVSLRYKDANGVEHTVVGGKSETLGFDVEDHQSYGTNERYIFNDPYPGIWYVQSDRCSNGGISAFYQSVEVNPSGFTLSIPPLPQYDILPYYDQSYPTYLTYQMHDDAGVVIENSDQPLFSVNVNAEVVDATGASLNYTLNWNDQEKIFRAAEPLQVPVPGTYRVSIKGITKIHKGDLSVKSEVVSEVFDIERVLFKHDNLEFTVEDVVPFAFTVAPANNQVLPQIHGTILSGWPLPVVPIPVRVEVHGRLSEEDDDENGPEDVPTEKIILNPKKAFTAWVVSADKSLQTEPIMLKQDTNNPDVFVGEIPWNDSSEKITLHVELSGEFAEGYGPDFRKVETIFSREDASPFFRKEFYYLLLGIFILFVILWIIRVIWMHTNKVTGTLTLLSNGTTLDSFNVYTGRRISKFKYKGKGFDLVILNIRKMPKSDNEDSDSSNNVMIYGKTECGSPFAFVLSPNEKTGYCQKEDHMNYEIKYEL